MQFALSLLTIGQTLVAVVAPDAENELKVPVKTPIALPSLDRLLQQNSRLQKRLTAHYYYSCPHSGSDSREFSWEAFVSHDDHLLHMRGRKNIDSIDHISVDKSYFATYWHHSSCVYELDTVCFYAFRGYTFGRIGVSALYMDLVTNPDDPYLSPKVWESCVPKHAMPPNFCSVTYAKHAAIACEMQDVDAYATA